MRPIKCFFLNVHTRRRREEGEGGKVLESLHELFSFIYKISAMFHSMSFGFVPIRDWSKMGNSSFVFSASLCAPD
jgi:hypothetical protein